MPMEPKENREIFLDAGQDPGGDYIVRATALDTSVRAFACRTTDICKEATEIHQLSPVAAVAMGRMMSGVLMLAADLKKPEHSLTAILRCDGPLRGMTVIGNGAGTVRGTVYQPVLETEYYQPGKIKLSSAVGSGTLSIVRDSGSKEPYTGQVDLVSGEIAEDLAYYLACSEQIPSMVSLGVQLDRQGVLRAGGLMIQMLPDAGDDIAAYLEERAAGFPEISFLLEENFTPQQLIDLFIGDPHIRYHSLTPCRYACTCSRERMRRNLIALGLAQLEDLAGSREGIELDCHFCPQKYHFPQSEINALLQSLRES